MDLMTRKTELFENIARLREYVQITDADRDFALDLSRRGICFVVTEENGKPFFTPSRFVSYRTNSRHDRVQNEDKDGRETNATRWRRS
jgi:hypothetical protein